MEQGGKGILITSKCSTCHIMSSQSPQGSSSHVISIKGMMKLMAPRPSSTTRAPSSTARAPSSSKSSNHHVHQRITIRHLHSSIKVISKRPIIATISICINWTNHHRGSTISSKDQAIIMCINWTMVSTIKCKGSRPSPRATSSTRRLHLHQPSLSKHHGLHHIIRVLMGQQRTIISNQGSNHRTVTTARVTIRKAIHNCCWHQGQSLIWCWHQ